MRNSSSNEKTEEAEQSIAEGVYRNISAIFSSISLKKRAKVYLSDFCSFNTKKSDQVSDFTLTRELYFTTSFINQSFQSIVYNVNLTYP